MKVKLGYVINAIVTTFVIIFPHFILESYPLLAYFIGIVFAVIINKELDSTSTTWKSLSKSE